MTHYKKQLPEKQERHRLFGSVPPGERTKPTEKDEMADLQNTQNDFLFHIDAVGITNVTHPIPIHGEIEPTTQTSVAKFTMTSSIVQQSKGTNMSRFTEQLEAYYQEQRLTTNLEDLKAFTKELSTRLNTTDATIEVIVPYFYQQRGPHSQLQGLNHVDLTIKVTYDTASGFTIHVGLAATITTLCPCSKEISEYSAHNQRGIVSITTELAPSFDETAGDWKKRLLDMAESNASARIHPVLKRTDEKVVTEHAYENPRFVEDMVRLVSADLYEWDDVLAFKVTCRNEESIHLHDAIASITYDKRAEKR
jgi:GTP cyclohydrolase I